MSAPQQKVHAPQVHDPQADAPRVTVVVIVRDGETFIEEALRSIEAQTMRSFEAVVVDDGSRDRTAELVERFIARDPKRFRLVRHGCGENRGMSASRNLGIQHARGEFITFLDHDDAMLPGKLARQASLLDAHPDVCAVISPNIRWHSWSATRRAGEDARASAEAAVRDEVQDLGVACPATIAPPGLLPIFLRRTSATPQSPMVRRAAIDAVGGFEDAFTGMYEDQVFLAKLFLHGRVFVLDEALHRYRQHDDSCVRRSHREGLQRAARRRFLRWLRSRLSEVDSGVAAPIRRIVASELRKSWMSSLRAAVRLRR